MLSIDTPVPAAREDVAKGLGFSDSSPGVPQGGVDEAIDALEHLAVRGLPVLVVVPAVRCGYLPQWFSRRIAHLPF